MPHMMFNKGGKQPEPILTLIICNLEQSIHIYFGNSLRLFRHVLLLLLQMVLIVNSFEIYNLKGAGCAKFCFILTLVLIFKTTNCIDMNFILNVYYGCHYSNLSWWPPTVKLNYKESK